MTLNPVHARPGPSAFRAQALPRPRPAERAAIVRRFEPLPLPSANRAGRRHTAELAKALGERGPLEDCLHLTWFAGGGGSSEGAKQALGRDVDYALNHDAIALRMHEVNHPGAITLCCDAYAAHPLELEPGADIGTMWFSPDCTDHSKAKGGVPKSPRIRGLAWCIIPWAKLRRPRVIMFENVEEWWDWGPLLPDGHADKTRRGETRARFVKRLAQCGYTGEFRELVTADFGGETTRKRLFGIFRCDGEAIVWPERTHAPRDRAASMGLEPWVGAASFIDFSRPCPSIFLTQAEAKAEGYNVRRPLAKATRRRIARGVERFVINAAEPFLVQLTHHGADRIYPLADPINTVTGAHRGEFSLTAPTLLRTDMHKSNATCAFDPLDPINAVTSSGGFAVASPILVGRAFGEHRARAGLRAWPLDRPANAVKTTNDAALASAFLSRQFGSTVSGRPITEPHPTVMSQGGKGGSKSGVVAVSLDRAYGKSSPADVEEPLKGGSGHAHDGVVAAYMTMFNENSIGREAQEPVHTVMAGAPRFGIVAANLIKYYGSALGADAADPLHTVTGEDRFGFVSTFMEQANTDMVGHELRRPLSTIVGKGCTQRLIEVGLQQLGVEPGSRRLQVLEFLWEEFGAPTAEEWDDPLASAAARLKFGFVIIAGQVWEIGDIGMRMLSVRELFRAQTFPPDYIIDRDIKGRAINGTQATLMCGNAVPPRMARLLYAANWPVNDNQAERGAA